MNKKYLIAVVVLLGAIVLGIKGKSLLEFRKQEVANTNLPDTKMPNISLVEGHMGDLSHKISFLAQILSGKSIKLSTKFSGYINQVYVAESQSVKKGDTLVGIDSVEIRSNINALHSTFDMQKSDLLLAKSMHKRNIKLYKAGGLAKEKLEISALALKSKESLVENTRQTISQLKHQLGYLSIQAPFDGVVDRLFLHEGDLALVGKPILSMSDGTKKLLFSYTPAQAKIIQKGLPVYRNDKKIGKVDSIYTTSSNGLLSAEVRLESNIDLPVGTNINIEILTKKQNGCILPTNTILHKKDGTFVMSYAKDKFIPLRVDILMQHKEQILLARCPKNAVAYGSEAVLSSLLAYDSVKLAGDKYE